MVLDKRSKVKRASYASIALSLLLLASNMRSVASEQVFVLDKFCAKTSASMLSKSIQFTVGKLWRSSSIRLSETRSLSLARSTLRPHRRLISSSQMTIHCANSPAISQFRSSANPPQPSDLGGSRIDAEDLTPAHYFQTALDLTVCIRDTDRPYEHGFLFDHREGVATRRSPGTERWFLRKVVVGKTVVA
jgi:hypothetical protein